MKTLLTGRIAIMLFLFVFLTNCQKSLQNENLDNVLLEDRELYDVLLKAGFKDTEIKDVGEAFVVQGDMLFQKKVTDINFVKNYFGLNEAKTSSVHRAQGGKGIIASASSPDNIISQYRRNTIISNDKINSIVLVSDNSILRNFLYEASKNWAEIPNSKLSFYYVDHSVYTNNSLPNRVRIKYGYAQGAYALAQFPLDGNSGFEIIVDQSLTYNASIEQMIWLITHELGHCIGLAHTDNPGPETQLVVGTTASDYYSIMNSGNYIGYLPTWSSRPFSYYDKIAIQNMYPDNNKIYLGPVEKYPNNVFFYENAYEGSFNKVQWDNTKINSSTITIQLFQFGSLVHTVSNVPNNGLYYINIYSYLQNVIMPGSYGYPEVQIKIIDNGNPNNVDYSPLFLLKYS